MNMLAYLLQVSACTAVFYLFYRLVLSRFTFFTLNRFYLLGTLLLSFVVPQVRFTSTVTVDPIVRQTMIAPPLRAVVAPAGHVVFADAAQPAPFDWSAAAWPVYILVCMVLLGHLAVSMAVIIYRAGRERSQPLGKVRVITDSAHFGNGSFFRYVFVQTGGLTTHQEAQVLRHELTHATLLHSVDVLLLRVARAMLWFNPFIYLFEMAVRRNHEFETDRAAAGVNGRGAYAELLLQLAGGKNHSLVNRFSTVPLRNRVVMLFQRPTRKLKSLIYLLTLPIVALTLTAFARHVVIYQESLPAGKPDTTAFNGISTIPGAEKLGKHPLVRLNGKLVSPAILSEIDADSLSYWKIDEAGRAGTLAGKPVADGVIELSSRGRRPVMLSAEKKAALLKAYDISRSGTPFYTRFAIDGKSDQLVIASSPKTVRQTLKRGEKVAFSVLENKERMFFGEGDMDALQRLLAVKTVTGWACVRYPAGKTQAGLGYAFTRQIDFYVKSNAAQQQGKALTDTIDYRTLTFAGRSVLVRKSKSEFEIVDAHLSWKDGSYLTADTVLIETSRHIATAKGNVKFGTAGNTFETSQLNLHFHNNKIIADSVDVKTTRPN